LNTAYIIGEKCVEQGRMFEARYNHGVLAYSSHVVYVFGGYDKGVLNSCTRLYAFGLSAYRFTLTSTEACSPD